MSGSPDACSGSSSSDPSSTSRKVKRSHALLNAAEAVLDAESAVASVGTDVNGALRPVEKNRLITIPVDKNHAPRNPIAAYADDTLIGIEVKGRLGIGTEVGCLARKHQEV